MFLGVFTTSRLFWILASVCFRRSIFRPDVAIFSSLFFTLVGSSLFVASQGLIDLSKTFSIRIETFGEGLTPNDADPGASLWLGIVMQAVSFVNMLLVL